MAPAKTESAEIVVDLHPVVNRIREAYGLEQRELSWAFFHTYAEMGCRNGDGAIGLRGPAL